MDTADRNVKLLVGRGVARAYGLPGHLRPQPDDEDVCPECGGDGCVHCDYTGDAT
jgi:hypothetical protein